MERYRNETAARKRKRRQARVRRMTAVLTIAVCAVVIFTGSRIVNARMNEPVTPEAVVLPTLMPGVTPEPQPTEIPAAGTQLTGDSAWMLMLVNKWHALPEGYEPPSLTELSNGESVDERMYPSLQQMFDDARDQGVYPLVGSGYRTAEEQQQTMDDKISYYKGQGHTDADARSLASQSVAEPGYSEDVYKRQGAACPALRPNSASPAAARAHRPHSAPRPRRSASARPAAALPLSLIHI